MGVRDQIHSTPEYQATVGGDGQAAGATATAEQSSPVEAVAPIVELEKGDVEFWLQVAQVILLLLILRELRGGL